ncbi:zinc-dependent alcohol dehydrogenase family protein [Halospeciosus flavus]|uniref:Zinc-dependent alcohol dehydrogenase family protein n=1 Tax=Halospeciosus flavus TaxID=3032283 RepID=A0ABD5Z9A8_9EURY|nr:zinc-dependent alcohol dehydrogenase family protein [Halospeciosus flavus]
MRAAVLEEYGEPLRIEEVERPQPADAGVVVRVEACGICRSDWHAWKGHGEWADDQVPRGQILGHEPAGEVVAVGDGVDDFEVGERVAVPFSLGDASCPECRTGHGNVCEDGYALGFEPDAPGAFAEYVHVPEADYNLAHLPDEVSYEAAAALGCRFMTAFHALTAQVDVGAGDWVAVHGCGGLGLSAVQIARSRGANVVAVDLDDEKLERARDQGAVETVNAGEVDAAEAIREVSGKGAHVSVDAVGTAAACRASVESLRQRGTHVQVGLTTEAEKGEVSLPTDYMTRHELSFVGSRGMPPTSYDALFRLIASGDVDPEALVTREVALDDVPDRLAAMDEYETAGVEVVTEF